MKKMLSVLFVGLLIGLMSQICFAEESKLHTSIELIGYFERINGQEWNLNLNYDLTNEVKIGIEENIHQYQWWQNKDNEYNTNIFINYQICDEINLYLVPFNTINKPYFKIKCEL